MEPIPQFQSALKAEIEELEKKGEGRWSVRSGQLIEQRGPLFIYSFILDDPFAQAFDDTPIQLVVGASSVKGHIVSFAGSELVIALEQSVGTNIVQAYVNADRTRILKDVSKRLEELTPEKCALPLKCIGMRSPTVGRDYRFEKHDAESVERGALNQEQAEAVSLALGSDVSYVWGPPGTGKTRVVAHLVGTLVSQGKSVLLVAHTNVAVDRALFASIDRHLVKRPEFADGKVLRLGTATEELRKKIDVDKVDLDKVFETKAHPLREALAQEKARLADLQGALAEAEGLVRLAQALSECQTRMHQVSAAVVTAKDNEQEAKRVFNTARKCP